MSLKYTKRAGHAEGHEAGASAPYSNQPMATVYHPHEIHLYLLL
jgi:hypothetical protein